MISAREAQTELEKYYYEQKKNKHINKEHLKCAKDEIEKIILAAVHAHKTHIVVDYSCRVLVGHYLTEICEWLWDFGYRTSKQQNSQLMISWGNPDE